MAGKFGMLPLGNQGGGPDPAGLNGRERDLLATVTAAPLPLARIAGGSGGQRTLDALARKGHVQLAGFTPSDAAHVLGLQANWSREAAVLAARGGQIEQVCHRLRGSCAVTVTETFNRQPCVFPDRVVGAVENAARVLGVRHIPGRLPPGRA